MERNTARQEGESRTELESQPPPRTSERDEWEAKFLFYDLSAVSEGGRPKEGSKERSQQAGRKPRPRCQGQRPSKLRNCYIWKAREGTRGPAPSGGVPATSCLPVHACNEETAHFGSHIGQTGLFRNRRSGKWSTGEEASLGTLQSLRCSRRARDQQRHDFG